MSEEPDTEYEYVEEPASNGLKPTRPSGTVALLGLIAVTLVCVVGITLTLVLPVLFSGLEDAPTDAIQPLTTLALLGMGALSTMLGGSRRG